MRFAQSHVAQQHDIGRLGEELQAKEVLDGQSVEFLGPIPLELFERFQNREARGLHTPFNGVLAALLVLAVSEPSQVIDMSPGLLSGLLGQFGVMGFEEGQFEFIELLVE